ncbi:Glycine betaine/carnitine/choline transport system permease protein OpuCB [Legionella massiliensis]|uniref:Glycine betaine/carnitine/choline transport system permease protein OpuCB n=1 Tax=Legionella massiliensis TaxID=1034943 RepID=A0A078KXY0_9GAMM|nr:glycine betaine ABC transporter substrate-binding protein [Legionella massiliensis]CDZ76593.1 Glycine betaine/carnitine/choline transport system permease protein OpuCB [Legionella massiliensis]CEE12331.1 Glycine betaine/carnitine/choline transport system permease protein OpuCB [Legionella massiliensis]
MNNYWQFLNSHLAEIYTKLSEHIAISVSAMLLAILLGVSLGLLISSLPRFRPVILGMTSLFQTIPSIALLGFLIPFVGIGLLPTLIALVIYALLPITANTYTGLKGVSSDYLEVANSLGFTRWQRLALIEFPLALPVIMAGIRTSMAMTIGITTIAAFIGAGGLGDFITQGLSLNDPQLILLGVIPVALLALIIDYVLATLTLLLSPRSRLRLRLKKTKIALVCFVISSLLFFATDNWIAAAKNSKNQIVIATKDFTEQYVLGYLMAELIEAKTDLQVVKKFNFGTTAILQNALEAGQIDLYPEYTGTAYLVVLKKEQIKSSQQTYDEVRNLYKKNFDLIWLAPFGFENSEALAVKDEFAQQHHLQNLSDLSLIANELILAAPAEFLKRPDGLPGLSQKYHLGFAKIVQMQTNLVYQAIKHDKVQVIEAFTTDGRVPEFQLRLLKDDQHFYPPYDAAPVVRSLILKQYPQVALALAPLLGRLDNKTMQDLNYLVDVKKISPEKVAHDFLVRQKLIPN